MKEETLPNVSPSQTLVGNEMRYPVACGEGRGERPWAQALGGLEKSYPARLLRGWHLLSLDGPTVAAVWMWFIAREAGAGLLWRQVAAMFAAVWVIYAGDRLLDGWQYGQGETAERIEARHRFHARHGRWFGCGMAVVCGAVAWLLRGFSVGELKVYAGLGIALAGWMAVIHSGPWRVPKEPGVGVFFAAAVSAPAWMGASSGRAVIGWEAVLFGAICAANCMFISRWEGAREARGMRWFASGLVGVGLLGFVMGQNRVALAAGMSAGLLLALDGVWERVGRTTLRACADAALLTPLVVAMWVK